MRLLPTLQTLIEQNIPWYEKVFQSDEFNDILPILKLFGNDINQENDSN